MRFYVITPDGDRMPVEEMGAIVVRQIAEGMPEALAVLQHARGSQDALPPEVADLMSAMLADPSRTQDLVNAADDHTLSRLSCALALAYAVVTDGASLSQESENEEDRGFMMKFHAPPKARQ